MLAEIRMHDIPGIMTVTLAESYQNDAFGRPYINRTISKVVEDNTVSWDLLGIVYYGHHHFTTRYRDKHDGMWFHDGIAGATAVKENIDASSELHEAHGSKAHILYYVLRDLL